MFASTLVLLTISTGSLVVPFWGLPSRVLNMNHKKELLRSLEGLITAYKDLRTLTP